MGLPGRKEERFAPPIVIFASERSGSNLLRSLLDNHSAICAQRAPHLLATFYSIRHYYGDLHDPQGATLLISDMLEFVRLPYHGWDLHVTAEDVFQRFRPGSIQCIVWALWREKCRAEGKARFASKDIDSFRFATLIKSLLPDAKFVHLVRDPRDQVASWMRRPLTHFTVLDAARAWTRDQRICLDQIHHCGIEAHTIRYEDLIADTAQCMRSLLEFIDVPVESVCFNTNAESGSDSAWNPYWENLAKPIMRDNSGKFGKSLSVEDILIVESIAKPIMSHFSYELLTDADWIPDRDFHQSNIRQRHAFRESERPRIETQMPKLLEKMRYREKLEIRLREENSEPLTCESSASAGWQDSAVSDVRSQVIRRAGLLCRALAGDRTADKLSKLVSPLRSKLRHQEVDESEVGSEYQ